MKRAVWCIRIHLCGCHCNPGNEHVHCPLKFPQRDVVIHTHWFFTYTFDLSLYLISSLGLSFVVSCLKWWFRLNFFVFWTLHFSGLEKLHGALMFLALLSLLWCDAVVSYFRGEEDDSLAIKPPQQMSRKEKAHHRKDEKRKEKRRHRSHSAEGGTEALFLSFYLFVSCSRMVCFLYHDLLLSP